MWRRGLKSQITNHKLQTRPQRGYMLIMLMLAVALAAMVLLSVLPEMGQQIRRDREEEMCHRGTQYMRAIQHFYKKFGRYPTRVEDLEDTNHLRFLRKRYKDPLVHDAQGNEKDFKLLHMQDVNVAGGPSLGQVPGMSMPTQQSPSLPAGTATANKGGDDDESDNSPSPPANTGPGPGGSGPGGSGPGGSGPGGSGPGGA